MVSNRSAFAILLATLFAFPVLGYITSLWVEFNYDTLLERPDIFQRPTDEECRARALSYITLFHPPGGFLAEPDQSPIDVCVSAGEVRNLRLGAALTASVGAGVVVLIFGARFWAGTSRQRLVLIFGPIVRTVIVVLGISTIAQAALLIYSVFTLEKTLFPPVSVAFLLVVALGALVGCFQLLRAGFGFLRLQPMRCRATLLTRSENSELFALVERAAQTLGSELPEHIVAGLEPNFFVTSGGVSLVGEPRRLLQGRTLFISLPLMRLFSMEEFVAVIGHELGHFRGEDTAYSVKFAPIYSRLTQALAGSSTLGALPAAAALYVCLTQFAKSECAVSRERELLADEAGAQAADAGALARALVKLSVFADTWDLLTKQHAVLLADGRQFIDLSLTFRDRCVQAYADLEWRTAKTALFQYVQPHPVDTHPPMAQRLEALGNKVSEIAQEAARPAEHPSIQMVSKAESIEQELTSLESRWMVASGAVVLRKREKTISQPTKGGGSGVQA